MRKFKFNYFWNSYIDLMYRPFTNFLKTAAILAVMLLASPVAGQQHTGGGIVLSDELNQQLDFMLGKGQLLMAMDRPSEEELAERLEWLAEVRKKRAEGVLTTTEAQSIVQKFFQAFDEVICNLLIGNCENLKSDERTKQALAALNKSLEEDGASIGTLIVDQSTGIDPSQANTYLTPAGIPYTVPINTTKVSFVSSSGKASYGSLTGYWIGEAYYVGVYKSDRFEGYALLTDAANSEVAKNENGEIIYEVEETTKSLSASSLVVIGYPHKGKIYLGTLALENFTKPAGASKGDGTLQPLDHFHSYDLETTAVGDRSAANILGLPGCEALYLEYKDSPLMESSILANLIEKDPCVLQGMTTTGEGLGYETEFMQGLNTMIDGFALVFTATVGSAVLLPIIAENLSVNVTKEVFKTQVVSKSKDFAMGFAVDGFIQMLIIKLSDDKSASLDYYQMTASGVENTFNSAYLSVVVSCGFDAMFENGELKSWDVIQEWDKTGWDCALGALSALAGEGGSRLAGAGAGALMRSIKNNPQKFINLLKSLGLSEESVDRLVKKFGNSASSNSWFNFNSFRNATAKTPGVDNNSLTNIPKSFWNDAYKVTPATGSTAKSTVDDIIANGDQLGSKTEGLVDDIMRSDGYKVADGKYAGENGVNGFDGVYYKGTLDNPTEIIIIESKQMSTSGSVSLNGENLTTGLPNQMSDDWITYVATKLKNTNSNPTLGNKIEDLMLIDPEKIKKYVSAVDKADGSINFLKLNSY